jgi:ATP-dependent Clp protease ATP-binding subunit ClpA
MVSEIEFPLLLAHRKVAAGAVLAEPLFFPEVARIAGTKDAAGAAARRNLVKILETLDPVELHRCRSALAARTHTFELILHPPLINEAWQTPLTLTFHAAIWELTSNGVAFTFARILELGIEVIAEPGADLDELLRKEALAALRREKRSVDLKSLAPIQTTAAFQIETGTITASIPNLKERALREENDLDDKKSILDEAASKLDPAKCEPAFGLDEIVSQIAESLAAKPPQSVLLVGPSGVGKTAAVRELVRRRAEFQLGATPFHQTSGSRLVAGQTGFGMWEERCQNVIKEAAKKRAVLHVGPLVELMEVGKSECNHTGIAAFLRPAIARGELLVIAECTLEQIPLIEKQDPQLLDAFRHVTVEEPDGPRGKMILKSFADSNRRRSVAPSSLDTLDRLHRRYATYSAFPGRPLRFLENLIRDGAKETTIADAEVYEAFTRETGLPRPLIDPALPLNLDETRDWFSSRVIGQADAVTLVVDLLATIKAGLTRPNRPIASFLFIGPTGVGKTEMAKALAEFLFGSRERLSRFDMSEFADPVSVRRLVGGAFGSEGLLTARVREQPFSVLLLDEVEKADASFFDLLLQALGEARLTDAGGRLADFRNTVVILTSNLGSESFRKGAAGFASANPGGVEAQEHFSRAVEQFLRPEMFNRLDRIVSFAPLGPEVVRNIADREWHKVLHRDGVRFRGLNIDTTPELLDRIAAVGFDPRYGARPLKRAMERDLLAPLARQLNRHGGEVPLRAEIHVKDNSPAVAVRPIQGAKLKSFREPTDAMGKFALAAQQLRRWHQLAETCSVVRELGNDIFQLSLVEKAVIRKQAKGKAISGPEAESLAKLGRLRELAEDAKRQREASFAIEDAAVVAFHDGRESPAAALEARLAEANQNWDKLLLRLFALSGGTQSVTLALFSESRANLAMLAEAYCTIANRSKLMATICRYALPGSEGAPTVTKFADSAPRPKKPRSKDPETAESEIPKSAWSRDRLYLLTEKPPKEMLWRFSTSTPEECPPGTIGLALTLDGPAALLRFGAEDGLHRFEIAEGDENPDVLVMVSHQSVSELLPAESLLRRGSIKADSSRRVYNRTAGTIQDVLLDRTWNRCFGELADDLAPALEATMRSRLVKMIQE